MSGQKVLRKTDRQTGVGHSYNSSVASLRGIKQTRATITTIV